MKTGLFSFTAQIVHVACIKHLCGMADRAIKGDEFPEERNSVTNC
jgi:hypothetical protein